MTLTRQSGVSFLIIIITVFLFWGCGKEQYTFSKIVPSFKSNYNDEFREYCTLDSSKNPEIKAVLSAFFDSYGTTLSFATMDGEVKESSSKVVSSSVPDLNELKLILEETIKLGDINSDAVREAKFVMNLLKNKDKSIDAIFEGYHTVSATDIIIKEAKKYHFLLLNESHYNSQNRTFTASLLIKLWDEGYRYLALETLSHIDTLINNRKYPVYESGYYSRSPVFGNMLRKALKIGYTLVPYEIEHEKYMSVNKENENSFRDSIQAVNIINSTLKKDTIGKVIIYAGYGHISELSSDSYSPMGFQLKMLSNQDILTIDQEEMCELLDKEKMNLYYKYAVDNYPFQEPVVFLNEKGETLLDDIGKFSFDMQVYHPINIYTEGIPHWRLDDNTKIIPLPKSIVDKYSGYLLQVKIAAEIDNAIAIDQFVIGKRSALIVPKVENTYKLKLINRKGDLEGELSLFVK